MSRYGKVPTWLAYAHADCGSCAWKVDGKNAMGLAAQHAKSHPGHRAYPTLEYVCHVVADTGGNVDPE